jgi:hypothetical protein
METDSYSTDNKQAFVDAQRAAYRKIRAELYRNWVLTIFCWDGLLPVVVILLPVGLKFILPRWPVVGAIAGLLLPVTALSVRVVVGFIRLRSGHSFLWQLIVFLVGISTLFLVEAFWLNDLTMPGPKINQPTLLLQMFLFYLLMMTFSLFPARELLNLGRQSREFTKQIEKLR